MSNILNFYVFCNCINSVLFLKRLNILVQFRQEEHQLFILHLLEKTSKEDTKFGDKGDFNTMVANLPSSPEKREKQYFYDKRGGKRSMGE